METLLTLCVLASFWCFHRGQTQWGFSLSLASVLWMIALLVHHMDSALTLQF